VGKETVSTEKRNGIWLGLGIWKLRMGVQMRRHALGKTGREWYAHTLEKQKLTVTFLNSKWLNMNKETAYSYIKYTKITDFINVGKLWYKIK
jgi:hypothetical protein